MSPSLRCRRVDSNPRKDRHKPADNSIPGSSPARLPVSGWPCAHAVGRGYNVVATARHRLPWQPDGARARPRPAEKLDVTIPAPRRHHSGQSRHRPIWSHRVLINNAGYGIIGAVEETPEAEFRAQMDTNFFGALAVTKAALPICAHRRAAPSSTCRAWADSCHSPDSVLIRLRSSRWRACRRPWLRRSHRSASR